MTGRSLFPESDRSEFMKLTHTRYTNMAARMKKKGLPELPFTIVQFRSHVMDALGAARVIQCRYCGGYFTFAESAVDHAVPLSRGGWIGLENIEYPCARDNSRKGSLTPDEYLDLMEFLEKRIPMGRDDVLERLEKAVQLMAGSRYNSVIIGDLRKSGHWQQAQKARTQARKK